MNTTPIINIILQQASRTPDNVALTCGATSYTYRELLARAAVVTQQILQKGLRKEDVVGILIPRGEWMAIAPVGVLAAACAYMPMDPAYPAERHNFMLSDSRAKLLIADRAVLSDSGLKFEDGCVLTEAGKIPVLFTEDLQQQAPLEGFSFKEDISGDALALLIYTSGSTGQPKGCMIEQRNISFLADETKHALPLDAGSRVASYASFSFVPTVHDIFGTLATGGTLYIVPEDVRFDFVRLAQFIDDNAITHIIMSTMTGRQFVTMHRCPSLRFLSVGGEKLNPVTPTSGLNFINIYGSSEACGMISSYAVKGGEDNVPIGKSAGTYRLYIVGEDGKLAADGEAGELWISGPQLCRGYLNHPELTADVFVSNPFNDKHEEGYERAFRTGDFVRCDADGNLLFAGRRDGLVKIRGFRVELREVEAAVLSCPGVKEATVQSADDALNGTYIVAYITGDGPLDADAVKRHVAALKPAYMVPELVMQIEAIPRNNNGKVDRERLPEPRRHERGEQTGEAFVPENDLQRELHEIIAREIGTEDFGLTTPLLLAGMTSVTAIKVASLVHKKYGVSLNAQNITKDFSLKNIEEEINKGFKVQGSRSKVNPEPLTLNPEPESVPLSNAQIGVYVDCVNNPDSTIYNLPMKAALPLSFDTEQLAGIVKDIIKSHPALSVHFESDGVDTVQVTDPQQKVEIPVTEMSEEELSAYKYAFVKPFNLEQGPVYRVEIIKTEKQQYLLTDFHHLVADGGSYDLFYRQLCSALDGNPVDVEDLSFADYVRAEKEAVGSDYYAAAQAFFAKRLDGVESMTELLPDLPNPSDQGAVSEVTSPLDFEAVNAFCRQRASYGITPAHLILSSVFYTLSRFANSDRLCLTTVSNGRSNVRIADTMGMFVNTLALSSQIGSQSVMDFICETSEDFRETLRHENYPFAQIANDYGLSAEIMFAYQMGVINRYKCKDAELELENLERNNVPKFPIAIFIREHDGVPSACLEYDNGRYSQAMMQSLADSIAHAVAAFIREPEAALLSVSLLDEKQTALLDSFNQNDVDYDDTQTVVSLFRRQAEQTPDNIAVVYKDRKYTYKEVDDISDKIAGYISEKLNCQLSIVNSQLSSEEPVVSVLIPRCEWMAIASLGVLKAGCAYQPLDPSYPKDRLNFMMQDASASLLIADEELRDIVDEYTGPVLLTKDIPQLPALTAESNSQLSIVNSQLKPNRLFIMLYTSGSTGVPKGCQLTHGNLVCFCNWYQRYYDLKSESKVAAYASYGFDACMMDMYPALTCGASVYIIPEELRLDLVSPNDYFEQNNITHSFMTTQVGYQFATSIENHSLKHLSTGGEKLASLTPPTNYRFHNVYGPTECTIFVTICPVEKMLKEIPIGKSIANVHLYIVDAQGHRVPVGAAGELWVSGPQVSRGYLNRPEKTAEVYIDNPFSGNSGDSGKYSRVYRTGDIVRYLPDGNIQFVGRRDGQVKIRGFRIELKEVEAVIREFPGIKDVTVQAFDEEAGGKFIAAYIVSDAPVDIEALNSFILDQKPPYMVPAVTMQIERIPLNQNQKVNKKALPRPEKKAGGVGEGSETAAPLNVLEQEIHDIIAGVINTGDFGLTTVLGYAGLTSIMSIKLAIQINKRFGVTLDSKSLAKTGSVQSIENEILKAFMSGGLAKSEPAVQAPHADMSQIPLSYAQMGVYVDCMKQPASTVYNIPAAIRFPGGTDVEQLASSVETIIKAHPQFRVHFDSQSGDIIQVIDVEQPVVIAQCRMDEAAVEQYMKEFVQPFNLRQGPLYRMEIVQTAESVYLLADVHHLIFDGASLDLFLDQLCTLMNGGRIEPESFTYADFVAAQKAAEDSAEYAAARDFFQERLGKVEGVTEVPSDLTNPKDQGVTETVFCPLDFESIDAFCRQRGISPSHHLLAATFYALSRFTNSDQLCITTISNGRSDLRISNTVGMFVNTLALSADIGGQTVSEFLGETSRNFDETLRHETYPFARIAADYDLSAEIMFAYQMGVLEGHDYKGQPVTMKDFESDAPKFRIAFYIMPDPSGKPGISLQYDNGRYSRALMESLARSVSNAAMAFISQPDAPLQSISLLDEKQTALLDSFNQNDVDYDNTQTVVSLFRQQVERVPDNVAVVYHDVRLTYRQVDEMSDRIAGYIIEKLNCQLSIVNSQLSSDEPVVSVLIPRCEWMVVASLGVLKAGCAYQPLDPSYPKDRLNFMMQDASASLLIADEELRDIVDEYTGPVLLTKDIESLPALTKESNSQLSIVNSQLKPDRLFIMLYTSGSTGVPKGCQLEHGNLVCFCHWYQRYYDLTSESHVAAYASYGFDACMMDMYPALTCGATVYIIGEDIRLNLPDLNEYFNANGITHSFITTQVGYQFATNVDNRSLKHFSVGGEKLSALQPPKGYNMYNGYGPTECTIFTTTYLLHDYEQDIPIGKPLDNMRLYIVDKQFNRLPPGAAGELWVSGPQVSRGYLNRPEKTAEVYIANPFSGNSGKYSRVYRTGDIVRYLPDGNIQFVGRKDGQVKIRGFRIELKEVEAVIREFPGIRDVTVQAFDYENGGKYIAAYIVADGPVDIKALNDFIGQQKPPYMIPAATMQIDAIPLNQNQKVNKKALPAPVIQAADREYVAPASEAERLFCDIYAGILTLDRVGALDNFFELGGTSLMVTRVIIEADKHGKHLAYGDLFAHPTPRELAQFVSGETKATTLADGSEVGEDAAYDYSAINTLLEGNTLDAFREGERQPIGSVLLTGSTGYLGIHVLKELLDRDDVPVIWCLVRADSEEKASARLRQLLFYYFGRNYKELFGSRLRIVMGDVTQEIHVNGEVNTVFNCAAMVKHFSRTTEIEDVNIGGAAHCVQFCLETGARLVHVSTYSTAGLSVNGVPGRDAVLTEQKLYYGQYMDNQYIHSKFVSERVVLEAVAREGLSAKVMRVGNLAPRSTDGEFQINFQTNSAMGRIRVFRMLGCYPYEMSDEPMEFSPINETARSIVLLSETPRACCLFHPFNNHHVFFGDVMSQLSLIGDVPRQVEASAFQTAMADAQEDPEKAKLMSSLLAYQDMSHGQESFVVPTLNSYTTQTLYRLGFRWSPTSWDYVGQFLQAIDGLGYFEA